MTDSDLLVEAQAEAKRERQARALYAQKVVELARQAPSNPVLNEIGHEVYRAQSLFEPMHSPHEALAVIMEEFEEYKAEVWRFNPAKGRDTRPRQREELIQLAAMAVRAVLDTTCAAAIKEARGE